jgi:hypothetical protein
LTDGHRIVTPCNARAYAPTNAPSNERLPRDVVGQTRSTWFAIEAKVIKPVPLAPFSADMRRIANGYSTRYGSAHTVSGSAGRSESGDSASPPRSAKPVKWLLSDSDSFMNGAAVAVGGGYLAI